MEKGLAEGRAEGRLQELHNSIVGFVHACYPTLEELANKQVAACEDIELLDHLRINQT